MVSFWPDQDFDLLGFGRKGRLRVSGLDFRAQGLFGSQARL